MIPEDITKIIDKLEDAADQESLRKYILSLQGGAETAAEDGAAEPSKDAADKNDAMDEDASGEPPFPPAYQSGDDFEKASEFKMKAADFKADGKWDEALDAYTNAILAAEPSALVYANRALALMQLNRPLAAENDCSLALQLNPDSAKALRVRGKARKELGKYEEALHDLSASQQIDFDESVVQDLKELSELHLEKEKEHAQKRNSEVEKKKKRAEEIRKAQEDAQREAEEERAREAAASASAGASAGGGGMGGMPGMGGMGGMPGMGGMGGMPGMGGGMPNIMQILMSDPELAAGMQNPKVMAAFQSLVSEPGGVGGLMANPAKLQELMSDPDVGPFLQKLMAKLGPSMGGGGMPMGGAAGGPPPTNPDIDLSDLPDLE
ncbi:Hsc70-interacting protein [Seminavis robusta]|uniref:Hsc70-interacting protein n=1 Tax=Seminavis robusta TaxID=568900 RepID=A0A9N8HT37_9STRA|nr:Hsc70-interacting protein [Seminavis robusta]|eukprot:Sro1461_g274750.1 Hsc70-interacting protein (380) ;mRNA; f:6357-8025